MPKRSLSEQFDDAVQGLLSKPDAPPLKVEKSLAPLLRIAGDLRDLPREEFRARLKADLRRGHMATTLELPITEYHTATPYFAYQDANAAIEFYKKAFGATERMRLTEPGGKIGHAEIAIGDSIIRLSDEYPDYGVLSAQTLGASPVRINLHVPDVDALARQAVAAGAKMVRPVGDQFYGYRSGAFSDPFGYTWIISTRIENVSTEEMQRRFDEMNRPSTAEPPSHVRPVPEGYHTITPYLVAKDAPALLDFVKQVFDAKENYRSTGSAGGMHADIALGDSRMMIGGGGAGYSWKGDAKLGAFHVYVRDCDAAYRRAVDAGAVTILPPTDQDYGERSASVKDAEGNHWYIATFKGKDYKWEGAPDVQPSLHPLRAEPVLNFVKRAFGAQELGRFASPDGVIHHVTVKIGDSYMEMGEAHGPYQPTQSMFYLYMPNVDALYKRALQAGAASISEPADQPYGDRNAAVRDPFGNEWYIATHVKDVPME
jgi:PhnB protein